MGLTVAASIKGARIYFSDINENYLVRPKGLMQHNGLAEHPGKVRSIAGEEGALRGPVCRIPHQGCSNVALPWEIQGEALVGLAGPA